MNKRLLAPIALMIGALHLNGSPPGDSPATIAERNGRRATEALIGSNRIMHAWLQQRDPVTGLLPTHGRDPAWKNGVSADLAARMTRIPPRGDAPAWTVANSAADLYPFLVIAAHFTEPALYHGAMIDILRQETLLTTRVGRLPDSLHPGGKGFLRAEPDIEKIIGDAAEYMRDGLIPITELLGETSWYRRMLGIATDAVGHAPYETAHGRLPTQGTEPNGNMLQVLSRLYWKTGDESYLKQILAIADFYFLEMLPATNHLPAHRWDFATQRPLETRFRLSDHGNEVVGGLAEAFLLVQHRRPDKAAQYQPAFVRMMDQLLRFGRNADGVWHNAIDLMTGEPLKNRAGVAHHAHCWGYMHVNVYIAHLATGETRFHDAVVQAVDSVARKPAYLFDEDPSPPALPGWGANAYSDAIESALLLVNRVPHAEMERQIDIATRKMLDRITPSGIVENWYGDGNTIRTALMYAMWKSQGARLEPWNRRVHLGAVRQGDKVVLAVTADEAWSGTIHFDHPRHRNHFQLPVNYPRLNEWPEWFTVEHDRRYHVHMGDSAPVARIGAELVSGLAVSVRRGEVLTIEVKDGGDAPYGQ